MPGVRIVRAGQDYTELDVDSSVDPGSILRAALAQGETVTQFLIAEPSIEQIFIERVGRRPSDDHRLGDAAAAEASTPTPGAAT
jgi:ABC-type uncharacterized transport system ATPase subunit